MPPPSDDAQGAAIATATATARAYVNAYNLRPRKPIFYGETGSIYTPPGSDGESEASVDA